MATITQYKCDRCSATYDGILPSGNGWFQVGSVEDGLLDLCPKCMRALQYFMKNTNIYANLLQDDDLFPIPVIDDPSFEETIKEWREKNELYN